MSIFTDIAAKVEASAEAAVAAGAKGLPEIISFAREEAAAALEAVEPIVETDLLALVDRLGGVASGIVVSLFGTDGAGLTGSEKANLAATSFIDAALARGVKVVDADASTMIKNAFTAVEERLRAA